MNSISAQNVAPVETAVPSAAIRVSGQLAALENLIHSLEARLESVLEPIKEQSAGTAAFPPAHPVPLAATLHGLADRVSAAADRVESMLGRLHV